MAARHNERYVDAAVNSATVEIDRSAWPDDALVTIGIEQSLDGGKTWQAIASGTTTAGRRSVARLKCFLPNDDVMGRLVRGFTSVEKGDAPDAPSLVTEIARRPARLSGHHSVGYDADGSNSAVASGLTTITLSSFTIASNSNRALLAFVGIKDAASITVSGITWNTSENLTQFQDDAGTGTRARGWYLVAPTATTANLVATLSADADFVALFAGSFYNVDQSTPLGTSQLRAAGSGSPRVEIGVAGDTDGMSVGFVVGFTAAFTTGTVTSRTDVPFYNNIGAGTQSNGATTLSPAAPATRLIGDCEILTVATENNATITVDAAWTRIGTVVQQDSTWQQDLFYRVYDGSDVQPAPSWSGSVGCSAKRANWRNAKASGPIGNINSNSGNTSTHSITGINASANDSRVGYLSHAEANTALGNDADYTERNDAGSATGPYRIVFGERTQATSGAGAADFSATGANASWVMRLFEILAGPAQTLREEIEVNDGTDCLVASMVTEDGDTFNQLCWEFNSNPNTSCIAVSVKPAATVISGEATITEAGDSLSGAGTLPVVGTLSKTEANDSLSGAGTLLIAGTLSKTEADDSLSAAGNFFTNGAASITEASDSLSATGNLPIVGALSKTEADDSISAAGTLLIAGTLSATEDNDSISADGLLPIRGALSATEASDSLSGAGTLPIVGTASITEGDDSLEANDYVPRGRLDLIEDGDHLLAAGWIPPEWMAAQALKGDRPNWNLCARCNVSIRPNELHKQMEHMGPRQGWTGLYVCWRCLDKPNPQGRPLTLHGDPKPVANPRPLHPT